MLKSYWVGDGGGGLQDFSVSPSPLGISFGFESKYFVSSKVWFGIFSQIKKREYLPPNATLRMGKFYLWDPKGSLRQPGAEWF